MDVCVNSAPRQTVDGGRPICVDKLSTDAINGEVQGRTPLPFSPMLFSQEVFFQFHFENAQTYIAIHANPEMMEFSLTLVQKDNIAYDWRLRSISFIKPFHKWWIRQFLFQFLHHVWNKNGSNYEIWLLIQFHIREDVDVRHGNVFVCCLPNPFLKSDCRVNIATT